ncbi:hypothetical protein GGI07_000160 [Coemansia sp. Benny D115]|nr:hypothetical protein GGI07_000160 [Coemansia sp. Benny D115]
MVSIAKLLAVLPEPIKRSLDQDTVDYLGGMIADESDLEAVREAAEPFLTDAGMSEEELSAAFSKLSASDAAAKEEVSAVPAARLPQPLAIKGAAVTPAQKPEAVKKPAEAPRTSLPKRDASPVKSKVVKFEMPPVNAYSQQSRFHAETVTTLSKDVDLKDVNVTVGDNELLVDTRLWLKAGCHYGMVGRNGAGKSTLLSVIGNKSLVGFPENIRTLYIQQLDVLDTDIKVVDAVLAADTERQKRVDDTRTIEAALHTPDELRKALDSYISRVSSEKIFLAQKTATLRSGRRGKIARSAALKAEQTMEQTIRSELYAGGKTDGDVAEAVLTSLYTELDEMDAHSAESRARAILSGLDISEEQQDQAVSQLSGGWRMRVALAKAMLIKPDVLLLDECTNHLDLEAIAWLQTYLVSLEDITIVCVSHDRDFLNAVSEEIIRLKDKKLSYHPGNYDEYEQTEDEFRKKKERQYEALQRRREHVKKSIDNFMKHARSTKDDKVLNQASSRKKLLERMVGLDVTEDGKRFKLSNWAGYHETMRPELKLERAEKGVDFTIPQPDTIRHSGPLIQLNSISFAYPSDKKASASTGTTSPVLDNISMSIMMGDHIALLGLNGCGKSTLVNIIKGDLSPTKGTVEQQARLRIGHYTQHFVDELSGVQDSGLAILMRDHPTIKEGEIRKWLGSFELSGSLATRPVFMLSGGQRARMAMAIMLFSNPHILLLDEVTNHLDMYAVQGLITAINEYEGTVIVVSHDRHFVRETCDTVYSLRNATLSILEDGVDEYIDRFIAK